MGKAARAQILAPASAKRPPSTRRVTLAP